MEKEEKGVGKFAFATEQEKGCKQVEKSAPVGYFKDAFLRFCKNKASIFAHIIILLIVLYALFLPLFTTRYTSDFMDTRYAKKTARNLSLKRFGILDGGENVELNERALINLLAIGMGASDKAEDYTIGVLESQTGRAGNGFVERKSGENEYQPVIKIKSEEKKGGKSVFNVRVDSYLKVGFTYMDIEREEYQTIVNWQQETGVPVLYPMVAVNEYTFDPADPNFWYKTDRRGDPVIVKDGGVERVKYGADFLLEDNYLRDEQGRKVYFSYAGGGNVETAQYRVRVLYYNYYRYKNGFEPEHLFGTDSQGYDLSLRLAEGVRLSLMVAFTVSAINLVLGTIYGAIEGYYGGGVDLAMERVADILSGIPFIVVATLFQIHLADRVGTVVSLLFAFVLTGWIGTARRVRTQFYRFKNQEYVFAARTLGATDARIIWKHIFPNAVGTIITASVFVVPGVIFQESMLSFLGIVNLGGAGGTSLGTLLSEASGAWVNYPHLMVFPALFLSLLMVSFNLFGNGLRDAFNPTLRGTD